jgi:hypothetical protein
VLAPDGAKHQGALDTNHANGTPVDDISVLRNYFLGGSIRYVPPEICVPNPQGPSYAADLPHGVRLGPYGPGTMIPAPCFRSS